MLAIRPRKCLKNRKLNDSDPSLISIDIFPNFVTITQVVIFVA